MPKATSITIEGVEFRLPFKMKKDLFKKNYKGVFGERVEEHYETLKKAK